MSADAASHPLFASHIRRGLAYFDERLRNLTEPVPSLPERRQLLSLLDYALDVPSLWPDSRVVLLTVAPLMEQAGHRDDWLGYLEKGLSLSRELDDHNAEAAILLRIGWLYQLRGKFDLAHQYFEASKTRYDECEDAKGVAAALNRLAFIACMRRQYDEAITMSQVGLNLLETDDPNRGMHINMLGRIASFQRRWDDAAAMYSKALEIRRKRQNNRAIAQNLRDIAIVYQRMNRVGESIECFEEAISRFMKLQDITEEASCRSNLGNLYLHMGSPRCALEQYQIAETLSRKTMNEAGLAITRNNMGYALISLEEWSEAEKAFLLSAYYWHSVEDDYPLLDNYEGLVEIYINTNRKFEAIAVLANIQECLTRNSGTPDYASRIAKLRTQQRAATAMEDPYESLPWHLHQPPPEPGSTCGPATASEKSLG